MKRISATGAFCVLVLATGAVRADEGRIPIYQATSIQASGHYVLTRDVDSSASPVISIEADDVVLDLNGRTISSPSSVNDLIVIGGNASRVFIRNGRLSGGAVGINRADGASGGASVRLQSVEMTDCKNPVILYDLDVLEITSCRISMSNTTGHAVYSQGFSVSGYRGHVVGNTIAASLGGGLYLGPLVSGEVRNNVIDGFGLGGAVVSGIIIAGTGCLVEGNTVHGGGDNGTGIEVTSGGNRIVGNVVTDNDENGLLVGPDNYVAGNVVAKNGGDGIEITGFRTLLENNQVTSNSLCGIRFTSSGSAYRDNMLLGNAGGAVCGTANTDAGGNIQ